MMKKMLSVLISLCAISTIASAQIKDAAPLHLDICEAQLRIMKVKADELCRAIPGYIYNSGGRVFDLLYNRSDCEMASQEVIKKANACLVA